MKYSGSPKPHKAYIKGLPGKVTIDPTDSKALKNVLKTVRDAVEKGYKDFAKDFAERLLEYGLEVCRNEAPNGEGELRESIDGEYKDGVIHIWAGTDHAFFVEFGTGIKGANSGVLHDEYYSEASILDWKYDFHEHGEEGWTYYDDVKGKFFHTTGREPDPFMYRTAKAMREYAPILLREMLK